MVLVCSYLNELDLISLCYLKTCFLQYFINLLIDHYLSILCRTDVMVYQYRYIVTLSYQLAHTIILHDCFAASCGEMPFFDYIYN